MKVVGMRRPVNESCVDVLERLLEQAKIGVLQDIAACGTNIDGTVITSYSSTENSIGRIAAATRMLHRLNLSMDEHGVKGP